MTAKKSAKRILLINRDFQLRYVRSAVAVGFFSTLLTVIVILFPLFQFQILRFPNFVPAPFLMAMGLAALLNFAMVAYFGVHLTHRIAGPMFSLVRQFRLLRDGNLVAQFKVRQQDELKFVIRNFNEMVDALNAQAHRDLARVEKIVGALSESAGSPALVDAEALRSDLKARIQGAAVP